MLNLIWLCVVTVFSPSLDRIQTMEAAAYEAHLRAALEAPAPTSALFGAAGHVARYEIPKLAPAL